MAEILLSKTPNGITPLDAGSAETLAKHRYGQVFRCKAMRARNVKFLRKYFALLNYAYERWEPDPVGDFEVKKDFEEFRKDVIKSAGFYDMVFQIDGSFKLMAKSIAFDNMEEEEFERLYSASIDVLLGHILAGQTREDVDQVVNNILAFV